jgi:hypothetical protein
MDPVPYALLQYLSRAQKTDRYSMVTGFVSGSFLSPYRELHGAGKTITDMIYG